MRPVIILVFLALLVSSIQSRLVKRQVEEKRIICYYTTWSRNRQGAEYLPDNIDPFLCTHILYAFMGIDLTNVTLRSIDGQTFKEIPEGNFKEFTDLKNINKDLKLMFSLGGWNYASRHFSQLAGDKDLRRLFVKNTVQFIREHEFDGIDLCWQYPAEREYSSPQDKENYARLIKELRKEFDEEALRTSQPRLTLSIVMSGFPVRIHNGFDIPTINKYVDFINVIGYDYYLSTGLVINHHAALYPLLKDIDDPFESQLNLDSSITYLLKEGLKPSRINMGIPTYGRFYKLSDPTMTEPGSDAVGEGTGSITANNEPGFKAYYEICKVVKDWTVEWINKTAMGPYAYKDTEWICYDDQGSIMRKAEYAIQKSIGGLMFWTIDDDDYEGNCGDGKYPLISAARKAFKDDPIPLNVPSPSTPVKLPLISATPKALEVADTPTVPEVVDTPRAPELAVTPSRPGVPPTLGTSRAFGTDEKNNVYPQSFLQGFLSGFPGGGIGLTSSSLPLERGSNLLHGPRNIYFQDIKSWITNNVHYYNWKN